jgi:hypothetical protein
MPDRFLTGVQDGWHAVDAEAIRPCSAHAWSACGLVVRIAKRELQPYGTVPHDPCPECSWIVAARTGTVATALAGLTDPVAHDAAADVLNVADRDEKEPDDPATIQLLAAISRHSPVPLLTESCAEGDCDHGPGGCPATTACRACSLQAGSWAGEWDGTYRSECTIPAPCAVLLRLAGAAKAEVSADECLDAGCVNQGQHDRPGESPVPSAEGAQLAQARAALTRLALDDPMTAIDDDGAPREPGAELAARCLHAAGALATMDQLRDEQAEFDRFVTPEIRARANAFITEVLAEDGYLRQRITDALDESVDHCARCKVCDAQVDAVMRVLTGERLTPPARPQDCRCAPGEYCAGCRGEDDGPYGESAL